MAHARQITSSAPAVSIEQSKQAKAQNLKRFMRIPEVAELTTLSAQHIRTLVRQGKFPRPIKLTENTSVWEVTTINDWINERIALSNGEVA